VTEAGARQPRRPVDGALLLDKRCGMSSNAALQEVKRLYHARKAGHAGTLDPIATGLLPILFGEATKLVFLLLDADKTYLADLALGETTTTGDAEGDVVESRPVRVDAAAVESVLARFRGDLMQLPPMYSALKHAGQPLYKLARAGQSVERSPRPVRIHELEALELAGARLRIRVRCSKGTYVRVLAEDIGQALGTGAHVRALRRVATGSWQIEQATSLERLAEMTEADRMGLLLPPGALLGGLPRIVLGTADSVRFCTGQPRPAGGAAPGRSGVFDATGRVLGVGEVRADGQVHPQRLLRAPDAAQPAE